MVVLLFKLYFIEFEVEKEANMKKQRAISFDKSFDIEEANRSTSKTNDKVQK